MNKIKELTGKKMLLAVAVLCTFGFAKAQNTQGAKEILTLTLDKALEIALDENPTMKVAAEEIALKKVASKGNLAKSVAGSQHIRVGGPYH